MKMENRMPSPIRPGRDQAVLAFLLTLGICANLLELFIPAPPFLPWLKPGFANAFTMAAICLFGPLKGIEIAILRTLITGVLGGSPVTSILIGGAGGLVSAAGMGMLWVLLGKKGHLSLVGLGIFGAFLHTLAQLFVVYFLFVRNVYIFWQVPLLGPAAILSGFLTGGIAILTVNTVGAATPRPGPPPADAEGGGGNSHYLRILALIIGSSALFFIHTAAVQALFSALFFSALAIRKDQRGLKILLRSTPLLLLTFLINALTQPGRFTGALPFITYEGLDTGLYLVLRFSNLAGLSLLLIHRQDFIALLGRIAKKVPALSSFAETGIRGINGIPVTVKILGEFYSSSRAKGFFPRLAYLKNNFPTALGKILEET
jgi:uncharacterized membrane protein